MSRVMRKSWRMGLATVAMGLGRVWGAEAGVEAQLISIGTDTADVRTGHLEFNSRGEPSPLAATVIVTVQNRSGEPAATSAELTGRDAGAAEVQLVKTEDTENGQVLHLKVLGLRPTFEESEIFLTVETRQKDEIKAKKSLPVRVSVPVLLKLGEGPVYEGAAIPGLVNRALNMRTIPKASVAYPEAKLASMCLHDLTLTVLDQFNEPLGPLFANAPVWAALGKSDYESTNRKLREDGTFIDTVGLWEFVGEVPNIAVDPGRAEVQKFVSLPAPPCTKKQYVAYEPMLVQYQVGGYPIGSYERQFTLKDSGDDHKPHVKITYKPVDDPKPEEPVDSGQ